AQAEVFRSVCFGQQLEGVEDYAAGVHLLEYLLGEYDFQIRMNLQPRFHIRRFIPLLSAAPFFLMTNTFGLGSISSPDELEELWAIDKSAYGAASIPFEKFLEWWRAYPPGLLVLKGDKRIGGAIGISPTTESAAACLRDSKLKESDLT